MRAGPPRVHLAEALAAIALAACAGSTGQSSRVTPDAGGDASHSQPPAIDATYVLPPVIDANFADSPQVRDDVPFPCGSLSGAVTAKLLCDRVFPDFDWDCEPGEALLSLWGKPAPGAEGPDAAISVLAEQGVLFRVYTGSTMAPMTVTCATLAPLPPGWFGPAFNGGFGDWSAACDSATEVLQGSSFELTVTSVGTLTSDALGADPLDASADGYDWDAAHQEIVSKTFHGSFQSTLVAGSGVAPVYVSMRF